MAQKNNYSHNDHKQSLAQWYAAKLGTAIIAEQQSIIEGKLSNTRGIIALECSYSPIQIVHNMHKIRHRIKILADGDYPHSNMDNCLIAQWSELPFEPNTVDLIILHHVLEYHDDAALIIREAAILLKPQGDLIITTFNRWSWFNCKQRIYDMRKQLPYLAKFKYLSKSKLSNWLEMVDCKIISHNRFSYVSNGKLGTRINRWLAAINSYGHGYAISHARKFTYQPTNLLAVKNSRLRRMLSLKPSMTKNYRSR